MDRARLQVKAGSERHELFSLGRACAAEPEQRWAELARAHFERLREVRDAAARVFAAGTLDEASQSRLRVQLVPRRAARKGMLRRDALPGLREVVVLLLEAAEAIVPREAIARWGLEAEVVFAMARENLARDPAPEPSESPRILVGDDRTAARVLQLDAVVELDPWLGAIVAVPAQNALVVMPVRDSGDVFSLLDTSFASLTRAIWAREPRPLTPELFWWRPGEIVPIRQVPNFHGGTTFVVPEELSGRLVGRIPRPEAE